MKRKYNIREYDIVIFLRMNRYFLVMLRGLFIIITLHILHSKHILHRKKYSGKDQ